MSRIAVVLQARLGSSRLPGKILEPVVGAPVLQRMVERVRCARTPFELVVATTTDASDQPVADLCAAIGVACVKGHPLDLLDRHVTAARAVDADVVVKIPSDCPLIDPAAIDRVLETYLAHEGTVDFVSNLHPQSWPDGNDVEVMPMRVLLEAHAEATKPHEREHTTPFIWDQPERYTVLNVAWETGKDYSTSHRIVLDYPEDLELIRRVYEALWREDRPGFPLSEILDFLDQHPEVMALNAKYNGVNWYRHHLDELNTVTAADTRTEP